METEEYLAFIFIASAIVSSVVIPQLKIIQQDFITFSLRVASFASYIFHTFILNPITLTLIATLFVELIIYISYNETIYKYKQKKLHDKYPDLYAVEKFLNYNVETPKYEELIGVYNKFNGPQKLGIPKHEYGRLIKYKLEAISKKLSQMEIKQDLISGIKDLEYKKQEAKTELKEIELEIESKRANDERKKEKTIRRLGIGHKEVFKANHLSAKEKEIAKEEGYHAINEYCVLENKIISVLVKPPLNHSPTHAFLVWSVTRLLKKFPRIERIIDHDTRDADLTFKIKTKTYAIEIEKGSLLRKKGQLREKIEYLDDKYRDRWLILVSNKNLAKKYREFGPVATRKDLRKKIEKWVKESEIRKNSTKN